MLGWYRQLRRRLLIARLVEDLWRDGGDIVVRRNADLTGSHDLVSALILVRVGRLMAREMDRAAVEAFLSPAVKEWGRSVRLSDAHNRPPRA